MRRLIRGLVPPQIARHRAPGAAGLVALTFDDGPVAGHTEQLAATLSGRGHAATFFVEGQKAERYPGTLRVIRDCGSEIANHTYSHAFLSRLSRREVVDEITRTDAVIQAVQPGVRPLLRPPFGEMSWPLLSYMLGHRRGLTMWTHVVGSSGSMDDADVKSSTQVFEDFATLPIRNGDIVLLHDWCRGTVEALPRILDWLEARQMRSVRLSALLPSGRAAEMTAQRNGELVLNGYHHDR